MFKRKIMLPTTLEGYDALVDQVVAKYKLTDRNHASGLISIAIRHLPVTQADTTLEYLGHYVLKNLANYVANHKGEQLRHEAQVNQLSDILAVDPLNQQARDGLQKAADEGSKVAKDALHRLEGIKNPEAINNNVLPIGGTLVGNSKEPA